MPGTFSTNHKSDSNSWKESLHFRASYSEQPVRQALFTLIEVKINSSMTLDSPSLRPHWQYSDYHDERKSLYMTSCTKIERIAVTPIICLCISLSSIRLVRFQSIWHYQEMSLWLKNPRRKLEISVITPQEIVRQCKHSSTKQNWAWRYLH